MNAATAAERNLAAETRAVEAGLTARQFANFVAFIRPPDENGCMRWTGAHNDTGYGKYHGEGAHRWAYRIWVGPIPVGLSIDHVRERGCRWRDCMNVLHMEAVTNRVNTLRGDAVTALNARKVVCVNGHEYTPDNTYAYMRGGFEVRGCRQCRWLIDRARKDRKMKDRHQRLVCHLGHLWPENKRVSRIGRVYCYECRVVAGSHPKPRAKSSAS